MKLSLVAEVDGTIAGHILLTRIWIVNEQSRHASLALAPVSVHPDFQNAGIGSALITKAHKIARSLGESSVILIGHEDYYPRFGYQTIDHFDIKLPFEVPIQNCMAVELVPDGLKNKKGEVIYAPPFYNI